MAELEWQDALIYHAQKNKQYVDDEIKKVNASGGGTEVTYIENPYDDTEIKRAISSQSESIVEISKGKEYIATLDYSASTTISKTNYLPCKIPSWQKIALSLSTDDPKSLSSITVTYNGTKELRRFYPQGGGSLYDEIYVGEEITGIGFYSGSANVLKNGSLELTITLLKSVNNNSNRIDDCVSNIQSNSARIYANENSIKAFTQEPSESSLSADKGYCAYNDGHFSGATASQKSTGLVEIGGFSTLDYCGRGNDSVAIVAFFDANKSYIKSISIAGGSDMIYAGTLDLTDDKYADAVYACVSWYGSNSTGFKCKMYNAYTLNEVYERIEALEEKDYSSLKGQSFAILGDSYSTYGGWIPTEYVPWYAIDEEDGNNASENNVNAVEQTWWYQLSKRTGLSLLRNDSWTGATFSTVGWDGSEAHKMKSFVTRCNNFCKPNVLCTKPNIIFIEGGLNDSWSSITTIGEIQYSGWTDDDLKKTLNAFCYVVDRIVKWNPQAKVVCLAMYSVNADIKNGMQTACEHYGIEYWDVPMASLTNGHPNQSGMTTIADYVIGKLSL